MIRKILGTLGVVEKEGQPTEGAKTGEVPPVLLNYFPSQPRSLAHFFQLAYCR